MNEKTYECKTKKTDIRSTRFSDGMIVTADDLDTAMRYPLELLQVLIKAHFGCGVVCGLRLHREPEGDGHTFSVRIEPGVALDCHGYPLKLCEAVTFNLKPDPCHCGKPPTDLCFVIRRETIPESPSDDGDDCDDQGQPRCQYRRVREGVCVAAFDPCACTISTDAICQRPGDDVCAKDTCQCLKECPDCKCCGESWVLLGCVTLDKCGITAVDLTRRKYVKPVECHCEPESDDYWEEPCKPEPPCDPETPLKQEQKKSTRRKGKKSEAEST